MGYQTTFTGSFQTNKPLTRKHFEYLEEFANTRRMKHDSEKAEKLPDNKRRAVKLLVGEEGCYFVGQGNTMSGGSIIDGNNPPKGQPGLWCQWKPIEKEDGTTYLAWDGAEKFYDYIEWLEYLIEHFLAPWGYLLNGEVEWEGERSRDLGKIAVTDNVVKILKGRITYE